MQVQEVNKRVDRKIEKVEENILQWIDEEAKAIRSTVERDLGSLREEVDSKNIEMLSKVYSVYNVRGVYQFNPESVCSAVLACFTRGYMKIICIVMDNFYNFCFSCFYIQLTHWLVEAPYQQYLSVTHPGQRLKK